MTAGNGKTFWIFSAARNGGAARACAQSQSFVRRRSPGVPGDAPPHVSDWRVRAHRGGRRANTRFAPIHERLFESTKKRSLAESLPQSSLLHGRSSFRAPDAARNSCGHLSIRAGPVVVRFGNAHALVRVRVGPLTRRPDVRSARHARAPDAGQGAIGPDAPPDEKVDLLALPPPSPPPPPLPPADRGRPSAPRA